MMKQRISKVNQHDSSKRHKHHNNLADRISVLPDSILGLILSCLPTKKAVATSILSKRWQFMWVIVDSLDFYYDGCCIAQNEDEDMKFIRFVNRVLLLHDAGSLNKFSLFWHPDCISSHAVSSWVSTAIAKNVHNLSLSSEVTAGQYFLPISVFTCDSLQSLELNGYIYVPTSVLVSLPRLESLKLRSVDFESKEAFENLISGCPMLYSLCLDTRFNADIGFMYVIYSTSLRRVELLFEHRCKLMLKASSLEYFEVSGRLHEIFVQESLSSLVEAYYDIDLVEDEYDQEDICNSIVEAVRAFDCAKALTLSFDAMMALRCATISLSTEFKRLLKLETSTSCCLCSPLRDFIQSSDNLEFLAINQHSDYLGICNRHDHSKWTTCVEVPRCLLNSLKRVWLDDYKGLEDEREMICYMLNHGTTLEIMQISYDSEMEGEKFEMLQEICEVPRKSPACEVQFSGWSSKKKYKELL